MIKLNGYWYSQNEVADALRKKGYCITCIESEPDKRGNVTHSWHALKNGETPTVLNTLSSIAIKEFHKKPPLI